MKSVLVRLNEYQLQMTSAESKVVQLILTDPKRAVELSVHQLAAQAFSSSATIVRMCRRLGFEGYKELKRALQYELAVRQLSEQENHGEVLQGDTLEEMVDKITYKNIASLEETKNLVDLPVLKECVDLLSSSRCIYLFGVGSSLCVARDAYLKFLRLNRPCVLDADLHSQLIQARNMTPQDLGLFISYSGQTVEMIECARVVKKIGAKMILITRFAASPLSELSDYNLYVSANESLFRNGAMSSRISQLNVIDILYTAYASAHYEDSMERLRATHIEKPNCKNAKGDNRYAGTE